MNAITLLTTRLRNETHQQHLALEKLAFNRHLIAKTLPLAAYVGQLHAYLAIHQLLEIICSQHSHSAIHAVWQHDFVKTPALQRDLAFFAEKITLSTQLPETIHFTELIQEMDQHNPLALLGILYVFEGSMLGANILRTHVCKAYQLTQQGCDYYSGYGENTQEHWLAFKQSLNTIIVDPIEQTVVIGGAISTFTHVGQILTALFVEFHSTTSGNVTT